MAETTTSIERGTFGTYSNGRDAYPAVVTHVSASGKTIHIRTIRGIHARDDHHVGYGHERTEIIPDPESVEHALSLPPTSATTEMVEHDGETFEIEHANAPTKMMLRGESYRGKGGYGRFTPGAPTSYRDPHF